MLCLLLDDCSLVHTNGMRVCNVCHACVKEWLNQKKNSFISTNAVKPGGAKPPSVDRGPSVVDGFEKKRAVSRRTGPSVDGSQLARRCCKTVRSYNVLTFKETVQFIRDGRAEKLCESRGGRPGLPSLISLRFLWT